jgi:hypothetical protein
LLVFGYLIATKLVPGEVGITWIFLFEVGWIRRFVLVHGLHDFQNPLAAWAKTLQAFSLSVRRCWRLTVPRLAGRVST